MATPDCYNSKPGAIYVSPAAHNQHDAYNHSLASWIAYYVSGGPRVQYSSPAKGQPFLPTTKWHKSSACYPFILPLVATSDKWSTLEWVMHGPRENSFITIRMYTYPSWPPALHNRLTKYKKHQERKSEMACLSSSQIIKRYQIIVQWILNQIIVAIYMPYQVKAILLYAMSQKGCMRVLLVFQVATQLSF